MSYIKHRSEQSQIFPRVYRKDIKIGTSLKWISDILYMTFMSWQVSLGWMKGMQS